MHSTAHWNWHGTFMLAVLQAHLNHRRGMTQQAHMNHLHGMTGHACSLYWGVLEH